MVASPEGCGVFDHDETCLCDVVITKPTEFVCVLPNDLEHGKYIAELIGWDGKDIVAFFEAYTKGMDAIRKAYERGFSPDEAAGHIIGQRKLKEGRQNGYYMFVPKNIPWEVYDYLREQVKLGVQPSPLVKAIEEKFGITIHKSYVSKTKKRMIQRGEMEIQS
jgi:hypothetical protein